jgi:hypothetical protein
MYKWKFIHFSNTKHVITRCKVFVNGVGKCWLCFLPANVNPCGFREAYLHHISTKFGDPNCYRCAQRWGTFFLQTSWPRKSWPVNSKSNSNYTQCHDQGVVLIWFHNWPLLFNSNSIQVLKWDLILVLVPKLVSKLGLDNQNSVW